MQKTKNDKLKIDTKLTQEYLKILNFFRENKNEFHSRRIEPENPPFYVTFKGFTFERCKKTKPRMLTNKTAEHPFLRC